MEITDEELEKWENTDTIIEILKDVPQEDKKYYLLNYVEYAYNSLNKLGDEYIVTDGDVNLFIRIGFKSLPGLTKRRKNFDTLKLLKDLHKEVVGNNLHLVENFNQDEYIKNFVENYKF